MPEVSALGPVDPASVHLAEEEEKAPWIVRKLVGSLTGRVVLSSYETLRSTGTSVVCLSPWGDSSPLLLPCIRFRDLAVHAVIVATGGMAAVAAPAMGPISDVIVGSIGDSILVEIGLHAGFEATSELGNEFIIAHGANKLIPIHSAQLVTSGVKTMLITLKYGHTFDDAALGFFRSSLHGDTSLFASVRDYLAVEKGWFSPYLFASGRRPVIPRTMTPDVVFCHGPFLAGDYQVGMTILKESAITLTFAAPPPPPTPPTASPSLLSTMLPSTQTKFDPRALNIPALSSFITRSRSPTPEREPAPSLTALPAPPKPRRLVAALVGLKPHRKLWTTSHRPSESVMYYQLLSGCPALVLPAKVGAPLVAWYGRTLEQLWRVPLPAADVLPGAGAEGAVPDAKATAEEKDKAVEETFNGVVGVLFEYLDLCVDWERMVVPGEAAADASQEEKRRVVREAVQLLVAAAIRSKDSKPVVKEVDKERAGIAMWRIP